MTKAAKWYKIKMYTAILKHYCRKSGGTEILPMANEKNLFNENDEAEIFLLTDETGKESQFELIDELEMDGNVYYAMVPVEEDSKEYVILKVVTDENGEDMLETVDDDEEFDKIADIFDDRFMDTDYD